MSENRTLVMGILNITPDSFADGGKHFDFESAILRAKEMIDEGVDIIDVGGESTRPGAERVSEEEERVRVIPVVTELAELGVAVSIDTMRASTAAAAIGAGATYVNDVSGGLADIDMAKVIAGNPLVQYIVMHWRGHSVAMQANATYEDVVSEVKDELDERIIELLKAGVSAEQIIIDPGIGFAKKAEHNWELLRNLDRLALLGYPILIGASRKKFLGELLGANSPDDREAATIALTTNLALAGVWGVRTHAVKAHRDAIAVAMELLK
ncbi:MAG: dihydropteroate synthase [Actinobacteria bacterium]|jgi:dihydropteroate synthase|nr:dihydropteroate synthase [Actinomycetota bacterium]